MLKDFSTNCSGSHCNVVRIRPSLSGVFLGRRFVTGETGSSLYAVTRAALKFRQKCSVPVRKKKKKKKDIKCDGSQQHALFPSTKIPRQIAPPKKLFI